jgi:hypothetical protein
MSAQGLIQKRSICYASGFTRLLARRSLFSIAAAVRGYIAQTLPQRLPSFAKLDSPILRCSTLRIILEPTGYTRATRRLGEPHGKQESTRRCRGVVGGRRTDGRIAMEAFAASATTSARNFHGARFHVEAAKWRTSSALRLSRKSHTIGLLGHLVRALSRRDSTLRGVAEEVWRSRDASDRSVDG